MSESVSQAIPLLRSFRKHERGLRRTGLLLISLLESQLRFNVLLLKLKLVSQRPASAFDKALWLHQSCRRITNRLGIQLAASHSLPENGLLVSNHLSHLDILLFGALGPVVFVAKSDLRSWPLLGRLAANGGTVFVNRERSVEAGNSAAEIETLLHAGTPVLLFPEGTTGDGSDVLPFRSSLFEPAIRAHASIRPAAIRYSADGATEESLAYYGEKSFVRHLYQTLSCTNLKVEVTFAERALVASNRKQAATAAYEVVSELRKRRRFAESNPDISHAVSIESDSPTFA